ncbi:MAG: ATP synthase subunit I [Acidobacteriota bacterium]
MVESTEPVAASEQTTGTISHRRLLIEMIVITLAISVIGLIASSGRFFAGVLIGGTLSAINFLWLERSLAAVFKAAVDGVKPGLLAIRYILRYVLIGLALLGIYLTGAIPMVAVILGLATFGFAVVFEGITSIFRKA